MNLKNQKPSKTYNKNNFRSNKYKRDFYENTQTLQIYFQNASSYFNKMQNYLNPQNYNLQNLEQSYNLFLEEIDRIKGIMEIILPKQSKNSASNFPNDSTREKEISQKSTPNIKLYKNQEEQLYEKDGIKLDTIESKNSKIREEIQNYSLYFEDKVKDIQKRDKFLEMVANIAVLADEFSYKLIGILQKNFSEERKFETIIYERAKTKFSAWVNKRLGIESSQRIKFFEDNCSKEFKSFLINIKEKDKSLLEYYNKLFVDLCELFTISLLYSEKDIELNYIKRGEKYQQDEMKDITELNKTRYVNFTVLPGLSVNKKSFQFAKALVFCESDPKLKSKFNINIPKQNQVYLNGTIKTKEINNILKIKFTYQREMQKDGYIFNIVTQPDIPIDDNPLFLMKYYIQYANKPGWRYYRKAMNQKNFYLDRSQIPKNSAFAFDVQINGVIKLSDFYVETNKILDS